MVYTENQLQKPQYQGLNHNYQNLGIAICKKCCEDLIESYRCLNKGCISARAKYYYKKMLEESLSFIKSEKFQLYSNIYIESDLIIKRLIEIANSESELFEGYDKWD